MKILDIFGEIRVQGGETGKTIKIYGMISIGEGKLMIGKAGPCAGGTKMKETLKNSKKILRIF